MSSVVLDTHTALWWSFLPEKLGKRARISLTDASTLLLPAIVFWEAALLVRKRRIELPVSLSEWLRGLERTRRVRIVVLDAALALAADALKMHADPADRFIVATALSCQAPLITKDRGIKSSKLVPVIW